MLKLKICWVTSRLCLKCYVGHYVNVSNIFCYLILITLNEVCWYKLYVHHFKRIILFYLRIFSYTICLLHHWQNFHSSFNFSLIINQMVDSNVCKFLDVILHCLLNVFFAIKVIFSAIIFSCFTFFKSLHILIMTLIYCCHSWCTHYNDKKNLSQINVKNAKFTSIPLVHITIIIHETVYVPNQIGKMISSQFLL